MNEKLLSNRLRRVADYVPKDVSVADIGSDHAYLPCYLCLQEKAVTAIAGELNTGPYQLAQAQVRRSGLTERIDVRQGDGLLVLTEQDRIDVITIAGMGGGLISSILENGKSKLPSVKRLILQPNVHANKIRVWLRMNQWRLTAEDILLEDGQIYEILVAEQGTDEDLYAQKESQKLMLGPYLIEQGGSVFRKKWSMEVKNLKRIVAQLQLAAPSPELQEKKETFLKQIEEIEEVLSWGNL